jgi:NADPH2:quinone reductase
VRAWQVSGAGEPAEALHLVDLPVPEPGPGEVRLRVRAAALGMPDAFMCHTTYPLTPPLPFVPGQEVCGTIDALGPDTAGSGLALGDRVMGTTGFVTGRGGFAEHTATGADQVYRVPDGMSDAEAAGFRIGFSTAWVGLVRRGALRAGEALLVLGAAGGSGATAVVLAKALGAQVIGVVAGPDKVRFVSGLGADVVIDRLTDDIPARVKEVTGGRGADVVYDPVGGATAQASQRCIAKGGRLLAVGFGSGEWVRVDTHRAVVGSWSLVGVYAGGWTREENVADHEALLALWEAGKLSGTQATVVPFADLPAALEEIARGRVIGKTVAVL